MAVASQIGEYKRDNNITIFQVEHWRKLLERGFDNANSLNLSKDFVKNLYQLIHDESIRRQTEIMNKKNVV